jgi:ribosomal protein S18 acetylase RimI-like enzyme
VHGSHFAEQQNGTATYLIAWDSEEPLGCGMLQWRGCYGDNGRSAYPFAVEINHLHVRPEWRGRGVGTAIIRAAEQLAADHDQPLVAIGVADDNPAAVRLYRRRGYEPTGVHDTVSYSWTDSDGGIHNETEQSELLIKQIS